MSVQRNFSLGTKIRVVPASSLMAKLSNPSIVQVSALIILEAEALGFGVATADPISNLQRKVRSGARAAIASRIQEVLMVHHVQATASVQVVAARVDSVKQRLQWAKDAPRTRIAQLACA